MNPSMWSAATSYSQTRMYTSPLEQGVTAPSRWWPDRHPARRLASSGRERRYARRMRIRAAVVDDAPAMGRVMVGSWLSAHRGQMPDAAWQKRVDEWTPAVSARGWAR